MVIRRKRDPRTAQAPLPFEYQVVPDAQAAAFTAHGGLPLVLDTMRITGVSAAIEQELHFRKRQSGYSERELLEAMVLLIAVGGDCMEDIAALGEDRALLGLLGVEKLPSPDALRAALLSFHDESKLEQARAALGDGEKARGEIARGAGCSSLRFCAPRGVRGGRSTGDRRAIDGNERRAEQRGGREGPLLRSR